MRFPDKIKYSKYLVVKDNSYAFAKYSTFVTDLTIACITAHIQTKFALNINALYQTFALFNFQNYSKVHN